MEVWFAYAVSSGIFAGSYSLILKIAAERKYSSTAVVSYSMFASSGISAIVAISRAHEIQSIRFTIILCIINGCLYGSSMLCRMESLKGIESFIYFPIQKTIGPIMMLGVGIYYFHDNLDGGEWFGIILGLLVPLCLIHKSQRSNQKNLKRGVMFLLIGVVLALLSSSTAKIALLNSIDPFAYISISFFVGGVFATLISVKKKTKATMSERWIGLIGGCILTASGVTFMNATAGDMSVVYTINSFSIVIPIICSMIWYHEKCTLPKALAIILTLASIGFMK